jgi:hypothetical protein
MKEKQIDLSQSLIDHRKTIGSIVTLLIIFYLIYLFIITIGSFIVWLITIVLATIIGNGIYDCYIIQDYNKQKK